MDQIKRQGFLVVLYLVCKCLLFTSGEISDDDFGELARQVQHQEELARERIRHEGSSGVVDVKNYGYGPLNYLYYSHVGDTPAAMHDHPYIKDHIGYGRFTAVLNGVGFTTRHIDPKLEKPSTASEGLYATEPISYPPVPESVQKQPDVSAEVAEMIEYYRAFKTQNSTHRNYAEFFKPILCYLEGTWLADYINLVQKPETWKNRKYVARDWYSLSEQARLQSILGSEINNLHQVGTLPRTILGVDPDTHTPIYGQWDYRVLCHPIPHDVPTRFFRVREDNAYKRRHELVKGKTVDPRMSRGAVFTLDDNGDSPEGWSLLDSIVSGVPGLNNYRGGRSSPIYESHYMSQDAVHPVTGQRIDLSYYNRRFNSPKLDVMWKQEYVRGFSDSSLYVALNTQPKVASIPIESSSGSELRVSYMIPLEVLYLDPRLTWNPYNVTTSDVGFFRTPKELYKYTYVENPVTADDGKRGKTVNDASGAGFWLTPSGVYTITPPIAGGVGDVRLRYPILPFHYEGSAVWKELDALRDLLTSEIEKMKEIIKP